MLEQLQENNDYLNGPPAGWYESLHRGGEICPGELLLNGLLSSHYGDGQEILIYLGVVLKDQVNLLHGIRAVGPGCVALLPQKLTRTQAKAEGAWTPNAIKV